MEYTLSATLEEIKVLQQMLHRACLHSGLQVAEAAALWNRKLDAVIQPQAQATNGTEKPANTLGIR